MSDAEILAEVYNNAGLPKSLKDFIAQEWQMRDDAMEQEAKDLYADHLEDTTFSKKWYTDVRDMERHRGLEIGPDGTVTGVK